MEKVKMVIVLRKDLGMTTGKAVAQACHGAVSNALSMEKINPKMMSKWVDNLEIKIVLEEYSLNNIKWLQYSAKRAGITHFLISDAGKTEVEPGTATGIVLGPDKYEKIDEITGNLKLYSDDGSLGMKYYGIYEILKYKAFCVFKYQDESKRPKFWDKLGMVWLMLRDPNIIGYVVKEDIYSKRL